MLWLPAVLLAGAILLPLMYLWLRATQGENGLIELVLRPSTLRILGNSLGLALAVALCSALIAVPLAWLTVRSDMPLRRLFSVLTALPLVIPSYIGAYLMVSTIGPRGLVQSWLEPLGVERLPSIYGFPGALAILTLLTFPYTLLSVRASLLGIDPALEDASRVLGRNAWQTFWRVVFPQLRPGMAAGSLLVVLYALRDFGAVSIMRFNTFTRAIYVQYQALIDRSGAAALALVLVAIALLILAADWRIRQRGRHYSSGAPAGPPATIPLGPWKWPAVLFSSLVVFFSLLVPAANLLYWLVRGLQAGEQVGALWSQTWNSFWISALAAVVTMTAALPVVVLSVRRPGRISQMLERFTYLGFAMPGVVIALALVFFGSNFATLIYQTSPLLIFAYLVLFLPQAVGAVRASLLQVHPNLEEAGRSMGRSPLYVFLRVTVPLVRPGLAVGAALVFLTVMKELPATLILSPIGFKTLATSVWSAVSAAYFAQAALPALLLIVVSSVPMAFLILRRDL
jgi:iron(III) transport system permease protein